MNILPKKRWHVRTKENIARVRRDEALAAEKEQERLRRVALAEQEDRTSRLRTQAAERRLATGETSGDRPAKLESDQHAAVKEASIVETSGHINFFQHLENGEKVSGPNEEYLREQKEEKEKYEKSIGYLTYLGQGSREETKQKAWFETLPVDRVEHSRLAAREEVKRKAKELEDPLTVVKKLVGVDPADGGGAGPARLPAPPPASHPSKSPGAVDTPNGRPPSSTARHSASTASDEPNAKRPRTERKHEKRDKHKKSKKKKHSKKKDRGDSERRRHAKSKKRRRRSPSPSDSGSSSDSSSAEEAEVGRIRLERLRAERLQRERQERQRADSLLSGLRDEPPAVDRRVPPEPQLRQRYNAQFNPILARQNHQRR